MLTYILGIASLFLIVSVMYFIKSRNKTEAVDMESREDDVSIYPLEKNIDESRRKVRRYDDGSCLECSIHVRKDIDFPFDYDSKEDRKRVTVYTICNTKEFIVDILNKLDKDDLIFIEDIQPSDKPVTEAEEDLQPSDEPVTKLEEDDSENLQPVTEPKEESGSVSKNSTEDL